MTGAADDAFRDYVDRVQPSFVKLLDPQPEDETLIAFCHSRGVKVIGRVYFPGQDLPLIMGRIDRVAGQARRVRGVDVWELDNETHQGIESAQDYATWSIAFMRTMETYGRSAAIGSFSVGQPELDYWAAYLPAVRYAVEHGHFLALHEYGGSDIRQGVSVDGQGWWMLRYRRVLAELRRLGLVVPPRLLITESGKDNINPDGLGGFRNRPGDYASAMDWYCRELTKDAGVAGVVDFGWATGDEQWGSFDLSRDPDVLARMIENMTMIPRGTAPAPAPAPVQPAPPAQPSAAAVFPVVEVRRGEGWSAVARRALGREPKLADVSALRAANAGVSELKPGQLVRSPWHKAVIL